MPTLPPYKFSPKDILQKMFDISSKYRKKMELLSTDLTNESDARIFFFGNIAHLLQNKAIFLSSYSFLKENNLVISQMENIDFYGVDKLYKNLNSNIEKNIINEFQTCLLLETFIELEGFMRRLGKSLSPAINITKAEPLFNKVIDETTADTAHKEFLKIIRYLRNTIHNKGMQTISTPAIIYKDKKYDFIVDENSMTVSSVDASSEPTMFNIEIMLDLIDNLYEVMEKIVSTSVVSSISDISFYYNVEDLD